jgi:hypothetical protein
VPDDELTQGTGHRHRRRRIGALSEEHEQVGQRCGDIGNERAADQSFDVSVTEFTDLHCIWNNVKITH